MDPISLTASLLTILGTAGVIGNDLSRVIDLRHAPAILLALNDEVASLYCVLKAIDFLIRKHANIGHGGSICSLRQVLKRSRTTLLRLECLVRDKLTIVRRDGETRLDRSASLFAESRVCNLKEQIRADRVELSSALSLLAS